MGENGRMESKKSKWKKYYFAKFSRMAQFIGYGGESAEAAELKQSRTENLMLFLCTQIAKAIKKKKWNTTFKAYKQ